MESSLQNKQALVENKAQPGLVLKLLQLCVLNFNMIQL